MKDILLYGISGAPDSYRVVRYEIITKEYVSIGYIKYIAICMKNDNPSVQHVYAMDQRHGLRREYMEAFKKNSIESWMIFKDLLETEGLEIL